MCLPLAVTLQKVSSARWLLSHNKSTSHAVLGYRSPLLNPVYLFHCCACALIQRCETEVSTYYAIHARPGPKSGGHLEISQDNAK